VQEKDVREGQFYNSSIPSPLIHQLVVLVKIGKPSEEDSLLFQVVVWVDPLDGTNEFTVGMYLENLCNSCMTGSYYAVSSSSFWAC